MPPEEKNRHKDTLNLPRTAFDMKANLLAKEPAIQERWRREGLYRRMLEARRGAPKYILHDGPPYANGDIHIGHALNKVLKDLVVRIQTMSGRDAGPFIHGWDCHGQPIEQKVVDELGASAGALDAREIRRRCQAFAQKWIGVQRDQFRRLGLLGIDEEPYITMEPAYEAAVLEVFARLAKGGIVYKQLKPVHWSIENRTALAEAELEYKDRQDLSIYVALETVEAGALRKAGAGEGPAHLLVWTTTPWTLPANLAVAALPACPYVVLLLRTAAGEKTVVLAEERVAAVLEVLAARKPGWVQSHHVLGRLSGKELVEGHTTYRHPIDPAKVCPVLPADYVTVEDGTGLVHTAPGHGSEDYGTALKHGLDIYCPVQADGTYDDTVPAFLRGMSVWTANGKVTEYLEAAGTLLCRQTITHSYPHDWRSKTPTIFRATEQWFIGVDRPLAGTGQSLRAMALEACRSEDPDEGGIRFVPAWGRNRLAGMLESRPDWCISRQRSWGLPIPAFYNQEGRPLLTPRSIRAVAKVFAREGSDAWFAKSPRELLEGYDPRHDPDVKDASQFPMEELVAGRDIFDVWFESGTSWFAAAMRRGLVNRLPVDLYLEGSDQHRGWFQLSLLPALGAEGRPPFRAVVTHGWTLDEHGGKMSKSQGNAVNVIDQLSKRGADILRLWIASTNYQDDIHCSEALIAKTEDAYRKVRNTLRYCMGACADFDPARDAAVPAEHSIDHWMRMELELLVRDVRRDYEGFEFHRAARRLCEFCTVQASSVYLSAVKDRLYCEAARSPRRLATQTVIHRMLMTLVKLLAPILPHTCDEAWEHIPHRDRREPASVHLALLPQFDEEMVRLAEAELTAATLDRPAPEHVQLGPRWAWERLMDLRAEALVKLEALRNAGVKNSLDAEVVFKVGAGPEAPADDSAQPSPRAAAGILVRDYLGELEDLLGVGFARVETVERVASESLGVDVEVLDARERYRRCARCWKRRPDVGSDPAYPDLSARDAAVMKALAAGP